MNAVLELEMPYEHVVSEDVVRPADELLRATENPAGATSLVLGRSRGESRLMTLKGLGKEVWQDEDAVAYVRRLREEWDR